MNNVDVRWQQRLHNFSRALLQLDEAMELMQQRELSKLEKQGVIQRFEYCYRSGKRFAISSELTKQSSTAPARKETTALVQISI